MDTRKEHWEKIYQHKSFNETSWYQELPDTSIEFFQIAQLPKSAKIIDIGGGESRLVDYLLAEGYQNITVVDISNVALEKKRLQLGAMAKQVRWINTDILSFQSPEQYDFWHDRATFHFLTQNDEVEKYIHILRQSVASDGVLVIGTFSENGPDTCSGLSVKRYSENSLTERFNRFFQKIRCITTEHTTPFHTIQNFTFCSFSKSVFI
ncbi:MAG TPA: class I SAM-dependent methyltransferase [Saprospiraceae bacterium]|nr:class I SAM-dependent methyltransferase [Saprospiraceae bacterium]HPI04789.1 class I SAM-dependent methyltransferase [Saprospiraceae bacterium]